MELAIGHPLLAAFTDFFSEIKKDSNVNTSTLNLLANLTGNRKLQVLLADDDNDDKELFTEAIESIASNVSLHTVSDGTELMSKLNSTNLPDIIFLDLNMPCKNGFECLSEIRENDRFKNIPVIIYSTSVNPDQVESTYRQGANLYLQKPGSFVEIKLLLHKVFSYTINKLVSSNTLKDYLIKM